MSIGSSAPPATPLRVLLVLATAVLIGIYDLDLDLLANLGASVPGRTGDTLRTPLSRPPSSLPDLRP